ncbi:MAG: hypothetical protein LBB61_06125 [Treponema sp.]|jgi:hypothetical protein|nr:hypothetical protein [Treponema sp.]
MKNHCILAGWCLFFTISPIAAQETGAALLGNPETPVDLVGLALEELYAVFGAPQKVYAVRGQELWQDDVVFAYQDFDCYIFEDHVWLVSVQAAYGVKIGDMRKNVREILGEKTYDFLDSLLFELPSGSWEMMMRVNFDSAGKAQAIFIYRSDM